MAGRGKFITFEGLDGTGKSTQLDMLALFLKLRGLEVISTREPGGTATGEQIREAVLRTGGAAVAPATELALMAASRAQSATELIRPALDRGAVVLCDRFHDSTEAYQGGGRGLPLADIHELHRILCGNLQPHRTIILELDPATSLQRALQRLGIGAKTEGRFEQEELAFFERVAAAYRALAAREPDRCRLVSGAGTPLEIAGRIRAAVADLFPE